MLALLLLASACGDRGATGPTTPETSETPRATLALRFSEAPDREDGVPMNATRLVVIHDSGQRDTVDVGLLPGACSFEVPVPGELLQARCWWGGEGAIRNSKCTPSLPTTVPRNVWKRYLSTTGWEIRGRRSP